MKKILIGLLLFLTFFLLFSISRENSKVKLFPNYQAKQIEINNKKFLLYIADTNAKREQGLSSVASLPENIGMIFVYKQADFYSFWMKDMKISLDFVYIRDNKIVELKENISPNTYPRAFTSKQPADSIIEFNAGVITRYNLKIGMEITQNQ